MNQPTKRLEIAVTLKELHTIQHALSYYSDAMHDTGDDVKETVSPKEAELWYKKAKDSAAVLNDVNRILATRRAQAIKDEVEHTQTDPHAAPGRSPQTATLARWIDNAGKGIAVFLAIVTLWLALSMATPPQP